MIHFVIGQLLGVDLTPWLLGVDLTPWFLRTEGKYTVLYLILTFMKRIISGLSLMSNFAALSV